MNLLDAIFAARPFKRPRHLSYMTAEIEGNTIALSCVDPNTAYCFADEDLHANDWQVRPRPMLVTYDQFYRALDGDVSPNAGGGVAIDVAKAWRLLEEIVVEDASETATDE